MPPIAAQATSPIGTTHAQTLARHAWGAKAMQTYGARFRHWQHVNEAASMQCQRSEIGAAAFTCVYQAAPCA